MTHCPTTSGLVAVAVAVGDIWQSGFGPKSKPNYCLSASHLAGSNWYRQRDASGGSDTLPSCSVRIVDVSISTVGRRCRVVRVKTSHIRGEDLTPYRSAVAGHVRGLPRLPFLADLLERSEEVRLADYLPVVTQGGVAGFGTDRFDLRATQSLRTLGERLEI